MCRVAYLKIKMKSMSSMQKVATLSMVFINTTSCLCRAGMKRTSFSTRISRKVRSTDRPPPCWPTISQTLFTKKTKQNRFILIFANYLLLTLDIKHSAYAVVCLICMFHLFSKVTEITFAILYKHYGESQKKKTNIDQFAVIFTQPNSMSDTWTYLMTTMMPSKML